jgi:hypothetical protein
MKLCFVSENGDRETYFVEAPRTIDDVICGSETFRRLFISALLLLTVTLQRVVVM